MSQPKWAFIFAALLACGSCGGGSGPTLHGTDPGDDAQIGEDPGASGELPAPELPVQELPAQELAAQEVVSQNEVIASDAVGPDAVVTDLALADVDAADAVVPVKLPRLELDPAALDVEIETVYTVAIRNTGEKALTLTGAPSLTAIPCPDDPAQAQPFTLLLPAGLTFPLAIAPQGAVDVAGMPSSIVLSVRYDAIATTCERVAVVSIPSDDPDSPDTRVRLRVVRRQPNIEADPMVLDLGFVPEGGTSDSDGPDFLTIRNTGLGNLRVTSLTFLGAPGFFLQWRCPRTDGGDTLEWLPVGAQATTLDQARCEPLVIPPNFAFTVPVKYQAPGPEKAEATLVLGSDDPDFDAGAGEGLEVRLRANWGGPCLRVSPAPLDFGAVLVPGVKAIQVRLESCGDRDVDIRGIELGEDSHKDFQLDLSGLGAFNEANPIRLAPGETRDFFLRCLPLTVTTDAYGALVADTGVLIVRNSSPAQQLKVPIRCLPVKAECAVCEFSVRLGKGGKLLKDGDQVQPLQELWFQDESWDKYMIDTGIMNIGWSVEQPEGSTAMYEPNALMPTPTFTPLIVGEHTFTLDVLNNQGCADTCSMTLSVEPPKGCHIELTWSTPTDGDPTDQCGPGRACGTDLDLHVAHPMAIGDVLDATGSPYGYFDRPYDCFWNNAHPEWDSNHPGDRLYQPSLDRDDTDGAGPENWTYTLPEEDKCYRIGVHYFDDHDFGRSYPTVRVFINSDTPVYQKTASKGMNMLDMWDVGRVCCGNKSTPFEEFRMDNLDPVIVKNYKSPF